jgi:DNA-binding beta-propeller fold protein YncE
VTKIPGGDPDQAFNILLGATPASGNPQIKPFGATLDTAGNLWVANNRNNTVSIISPEGRLIDTLSDTSQGKTVLSRPMADAADSKGNVWVPNPTGWMCPARRRI